MKYDLYSVGEMVIDFTPGMERNSYIANPGGAPANVAIAMSRMGKQCIFTGKVGADDFGDQLIKVLEKNHVTIGCETRCEQAVTTLVFVSLKENGERSFTFARKPGADMYLDIRNINMEKLLASRIIHAGSCSLSAGQAAEATRYALRQGKLSGKIVSFDFNYRAPMWEEDKEKAVAAAREVLPWVDLLKLSEEELFLLKEEEPVSFMEHFGLQVLVVTMGERGSKAFFRGKCMQEPAIKTKAVDTNGAGDAFWGGFLTGILERGKERAENLAQEDIKKGLLLGTVMGSLAVREPGAIPALPFKEQVEQLLREEGLE